MHAALIAIHAASAVIAFGLGSAVILEPSARQDLFRPYLGTLIIAIVALAAVVIIDWHGLDSGSKIAYSILVLLAAYMLWRANLAKVALATKPLGWELSSIDHIGFTLISLFDGFVIVGAIDLNFPGWLVAIIGVLGVAGGIATVNRLKLRVADESR